MADFFENLSNNFGLDKSRILNRKIDKDRDNFVKGIRYSKSGQKEDPTYLGFRFIFDFGISKIDPENFLPPSPLFLSLKDQSVRGFPDSFFDQQNDIRDNLIGQNDGTYLHNVDFFTGHFAPVSGTQKASSTPIAYMGAQKYLYERWDSTPEPTSAGFSKREKGIPKESRHHNLEAFKESLRNINARSPWYFQSISGLKSLVTHKHTDPNGQATPPYRKGTLTISCLESIDLRISAMAELYKKATYDYIHHRKLVPSNLLKFRMYIVITEIRNIQLRNDINDILNPFSIPVVSSAANFVSSFGQAGGIINPFADSYKRGEAATGLEPESYNTLPYVMIYQLDQCEFDFDETTPITENFDNGTGNPQMASATFKIHVGRVKDHKLQYNLVEDIISKGDILKGMLLCDHYNNEGSVISPGGSLSDTENTPGDFFAKLASNFINNTVTNIKNDIVSAASREVLGNAYGFQINQVGEALSSAQQLGAFLRDGTPPFRDGNPQKNGLGGPIERVYSKIDSDLYPNVPEQGPVNLGNVLNPPGPSNLTPSDLYPTVPGGDLGLPGRVYPTNSIDQYISSNGTALGVPFRVYPTTSGDDYINVPGTDLGLPNRQYPVNTGDEYTAVSGTDLGVPQRIYPTATGDEYTTNPGSDLGLPNRQYPVNTNDEYTTVAGADLGVPQRIYPTITGDVYTSNPGSDLGLPNRQYPVNTNDEYTSVAGTDLGVPQRIYPVNTLDDYPTNPGQDLGLPGRQYPANIVDEYPTSQGVDLGVPQRIYPVNTLDDYPTNPTPDLGLPGRQYPANIVDEYPTSQGVDLGVPQRIYPVNTLDDYPTNPTPDLGLPGRQYPTNGIDEYPTSQGVDLGTPQRIYPVNTLDDYPTNPTPDLGLLGRQYPTNGIDEYTTSKGTDLGAPQRIYPVNTLDDYSTNPTPDLGLPSRQYPVVLSDGYTTSQGVSLGTPQRIYPSNNLDEYLSAPGPESSLPSRQYTPIRRDEYPTVSAESLEGRIYPLINENLYQDLITKYPTVRGKVYPVSEVEDTPELNETLYKTQDRIEYPRVEIDEYMDRE